MCIAAYGSDKLIGVFSNWGTCLEFGAVGVYTECAHPDLIPGFWSGTSMATPYGGAIAGLAFEVAFNNDEVRQAVLAGCLDTQEPAYKEGQGFADALATIEKLAPEPEPEPELYYPELPRKTWTKFRLSKPRPSSTVITFLGEEAGVYLEKKS